MPYPQRGWQIRAAVIDMLQRCRDPQGDCEHNGEDYVLACLKDAETALDLAVKRLRGESTLAD
jgi:hypothetical protein